MELTLNHNSLGCYQLICHRAHGQEETMEAIVPDACPDILRVVETCGQIYLRGKQAREGVASVSGLIQSAVLYQPEGEGSLRRVAITLPFDSQIPIPNLDSQGELVVTTQLRSIEGRALNPRKLLVRADILLTVQGYMPQQYTICHSVTAPAEAGIQQTQDSHDTYLVMAVQGKPFTFSEQIRLPGQGEIGEILSCRAQPNCSECRRIGNKLIAKGSLGVALLVREPAGNLAVSEHQLPFSQIIEMSGGGDAGDCQIQLEVVQLEILPSPEGGKQLEIQAELMAQAVVRGHCTVPVLTDTYSTSWEMETEWEEHSLPALEDSSSNTQNLRELLELEGTVRKVVDCWCQLGELSQQREGNRIQLAVDVSVTLLYVDENGSLQSSSHVVSGGMWLDCLEHIQCQAACRCPQEVFATPAAGGVEVRVALQFDYLLLRQESAMAISSAELTQPRGRGEGSPSVVLRRREMGESLWQMAKCYGTTGAELLTANGLEEDGDLPLGMLLIPNSRVN